jgi:hypothetical protein
MEQAQHNEEMAGVLPVLLTSAVLHARLHPDLALGSWRNWLKLAILKHDFPTGARIGACRVLWRSDEVFAWLESRPPGGRFDGRRRASHGPEAA